MTEFVAVKHDVGHIEWGSSRDAVPDGVVQVTVYDVASGKRVATVFDDDAAALVVAAPRLRRALERLEAAAFSREVTMGDQCNLLECKANLNAAAAEAREVLDSIRRF